MNKGAIIQENLRLKGLLDHCNKQLMQALYTIDELTKENAELSLRIGKISGRSDTVQETKTILDRDIDEFVVKTECKQDQGKPRLDLVPLEIVEAIGIVMTKALETYTEGSWRRVETFRFKAAMMRHLVRYMANPKSVAKDTKLPHLWHLATNIAFLISLEGMEVE